MQTSTVAVLRMPTAESSSPARSGTCREIPRDQVTVSLASRDVISSAGVAMILRDHPGVTVTTRDTPTDVMVFVCTAASPAEIRWLRTASGSSRAVVLVAEDVSEESLLALIECGVVAILDRTSLTTTDLAAAVLDAARNHGAIPKQLLGTLLGLVRAMQHNTLGSLGVKGAGLTEREVEVLRLLADGAETAEIAERLTYSESTIKHVLHKLMTRFKFRNRVHAVAFAVRAGIL